MRLIFSALALCLSILPAAAVFAGEITARTNLPRGTVLAAHHVDTAGLTPFEAQNQLDSLLGKELRRNLRAGAALHPAHVQNTITVRRNAQVKMIYRAGPIELTAWGRAMDEGGTNDVISLLNLESRKRISGRILPSGDVEVGL